MVLVQEADVREAGHGTIKVGSRDLRPLVLVTADEDRNGAVVLFPKEGNAFKKISAIAP